MSRHKPRGVDLCPFGPELIGRGDKIRTCDPLHPMLGVSLDVFRLMPVLAEQR
jgi:hypothetical protein